MAWLFEPRPAAAGRGFLILVICLLVMLHTDHAHA